MKKLDVIHYFTCDLIYIFSLFITVSKSKDIVWSNVARPISRTLQRNIIKHQSGPTRFAKSNIFDPLSSFLQIFTNEMIEDISKYTNMKLLEAKESPITVNDMKKFIGLIVLAGTMNSNMESIDWMWHPEYGICLCKKLYIFE